MQTVKMSLGIFPLIGIIFLSCNSPADNSIKPIQNENPNMDRNNVKVGGLYALFDEEDSSMYIVKILALDSFVVHIRTYRDRFNSVPDKLSSDKLQILIGHAPLTIEEFLEDNPKLVKVEIVSDEEL